MDAKAEVAAWRDISIAEESTGAGHMKTGVVRSTQTTGQQRTVLLTEYRNDMRKKQQRDRVRLAMTITPDDLDHEAPAAGPLLTTSRKESGTSRVLEDFPDALTGSC